jgi:HlyD family secretion protein
VNHHIFPRRAQWNPLLAPIFALLVGLSLMTAGCSSGEAPEPEPVVAVRAAKVQKKAVQDVIDADAVLYPLKEATIVPKVSAPIQKFYVNRGSRVHAGELLAVLENKDLSAAVEEARGAFDQAQAAYATSTKVNLPAEIQSAELNVEATRQAMQANELIYQSRLKLFRSGAMSRNLMNESHVSYIQSRNQYQIAVAHLKALQAVGKSQSLKSAAGQLAAAKGRYQGALAQLNYSEIRSPIDGVITDRPLYEGQLATTGAPLLTVMNISHVVGRAYVSPQQAAQLHVGDPATISPGNGQADVPARVSVVSPALDPNSTTVQVWVDAANPGGRLKPGLTVRVHMVAQTVKDALVIPAEAVLTADDGTTSVMVIGPDEHAHQTIVKTGIRAGEEVEIVSGLHAGEQVVAAGAYGLPDGTKVKITSGATPGGGPPN